MKKYPGKDTETFSKITRYDDGEYAVEVAILTRFGLSPLEAIAAATKNAAEVVHLEDSIGTIEAGRSADLLVVAGDPTVRIEDLRRVALVIRAGRVVHTGPTRI